MKYINVGELVESIRTYLSTHGKIVYYFNGSNYISYYTEKFKLSYEFEQLLEDLMIFSQNEIFGITLDDIQGWPKNFENVKKIAYELLTNLREGNLICADISLSSIRIDYGNKERVIEIKLYTK